MLQSQAYIDCKSGKNRIGSVLSDRRRGRGRGFRTVPDKLTFQTFQFEHFRSSSTDLGPRILGADSDVKRYYLNAHSEKHGGPVSGEG